LDWHDLIVRLSLGWRDPEDRRQTISAEAYTGLSSGFSFLDTVAGKWIWWSAPMLRSNGGSLSARLRFFDTAQGVSDASRW
jgi:hypothetical protein